MITNATRLIQQTYGYDKDFDISYSKEASKSDSSTGGHLWVLATEERENIEMIADTETESISVLVPEYTRDSSQMKEEAPSILDEIDEEAYREESWISLFGDSPPPEKYKGAVAECSGILDEIFPPGSDGDRILDKVLRDSRIYESDSED